MEKVQNLLSFSDFEKGWKAKDPKKTKRTDVGLDVVEKKKLEEIMDEEILDDDVDLVEDEIIDDEEIETDEEIDDADWKDQLKNLIDSIIEDGEEADEVFDYLEELESEYVSDEEGEEVDIDDEEIVDDEEVADDEEGEEIEESVKSFKNWKK